MEKSAKEFMAKAIDSARKGVKNFEGGPFGACIVKNKKIIAIAHNTVLKKNNPTCHAEINAISIACMKLKNWNLNGCKIFSTTEPCPMCFSAIHWAKIDEVFYGTNISDVKKLGFNELAIDNFKLKKIGKSKVKISKNFMRKDCLELLEFWKKTGGKLY